MVIMTNPLHTYLPLSTQCAEINMADIKKRSRNKRVLILPDAVRAVRVIIQGRWVCCLGPIVSALKLLTICRSTQRERRLGSRDGREGQRKSKQVSKQWKRDWFSFPPHTGSSRRVITAVVAS